MAGNIEKVALKHISNGINSTNLPLMTFEDYKKDFEIFSKIDTEEKLAFCRTRYEQHLLHIEDEAFFEPVQERVGDDIISQYNRNLKAIFRLDDIKSNQIHFFIKPSFDPESLLILERQEHQYLLTHVTQAKSYWSLFYADNTIMDTKKISVHATLRTSIGGHVFAMLKMAIDEARKPQAGGFVLDGVVYELSILVDGQRKSVFKHSPGESSRSGGIIDIMQQIMDNMGHLDELFLSHIDTAISELLHL